MNRHDGLTIRRVKAGDGACLHTLFLNSVERLSSGHYTGEQIRAWTSHITPDRLEVRLLRCVSYVALEDGHAAGFGSLDVHHAELDFLYVHPRSVRRGIGRRLTEVLEWEAIRYGIKRLGLTASLNAVTIYERLGYLPTRSMRKTIDGVVVPCQRMEKKLTNTEVSPPPSR